MSEKLSPRDDGVLLACEGDGDHDEDFDGTLVVHRFAERARETPSALALAVYPAGAARPSSLMTWSDWYAASQAVAAQLLLRGVAVGDRVAVLAPNVPMWPIADMAVQMIGAIAVGIYPTSTPTQIRELLTDSGATMVLASGASHVRTLREIRDSMETTFAIIGDAPELSDENHAAATLDAPWSSWLDTGAARLLSDETLRSLLAARTLAVKPVDLAALIYTSGSTGVPKGACISHRCLAASAASIAEVLQLADTDSALSFLPYSHAAERVFGQCTRITVGMCAALIEDPTDVFNVARTFEPTLLGALPRIFERLHEAAVLARRSGGDPTRAIAERIGTRCRLATSGGAAMPSEIASELAALGLTILGAYGQTEHLCIAMHRPGHARFDSVGQPMPGTSVRVAPDGELFVRRSALTFSGYWSNPAATAAAFTPDGLWLRTGDLAALDVDGTLRITGRVKELIALSTGRKIAPLPIEAALVATPLIAHAMCYGEGHKYLTALLSLRRAVVEAWAREQHIDVAWPALAHDARLREQLERAVDSVNATLARTDRIQRFAVTEHEFSLDGGELTPTFKLVRRVLASRYATILEGLYQ